MADYAKPLPALTKLNRPYFEGGLRGELRLQRCTSCGHRWFPASTHCPRCLATEHEWAPVSGHGRVWSWIVMHQRYFKAFESEIPYNVALVQLEEGPLMMSALVDIPPADIRCDLPVQVVFERVTDEIALPKFRRAEA